MTWQDTIVYVVNKLVVPLYLVLSVYFMRTGILIAATLHQKRQETVKLKEMLDHQAESKRPRR